MYNSPDWRIAIGRTAGQKPAVALCGPMRLDTHVYIDGFNLYYGLLKGSAYKWLDLERFCDQLLPRNTVTEIHYFTAKVDARPQDSAQPVRQQAYLQALQTLGRVQIHLGTFLSSVVSQVVVEIDMKPFAAALFRFPDGHRNHLGRDASTPSALRDDGVE